MVAEDSKEQLHISLSISTQESPLSNVVKPLSTFSESSDEDKDEKFSLFRRVSKIAMSYYFLFFLFNLAFELLR
jgi:hypothetical protein